MDVDLSPVLSHLVIPAADAPTAAAAARTGLVPCHPGGVWPLRRGVVAPTIQGHRETAADQNDHHWVSRHEPLVKCCIFWCRVVLGQEACAKNVENNGT